MSYVKGRIVKLRMSVLGGLCLAACAVVPGTALADAATFEKSGCTSCHGDKGQGVDGLAPPLRNNAWVKSASADQIKETIVKGRKGKERRHPNFPTGMPPNSVPDEDLDKLVAHVKGDLQK
jgi:mono/diheme cytochrome c family protein